MLEHLIKLFPLIFSIWSGILIVSGIFIGAGLYQVIKAEKSAGRDLNDKNDEINLVVCAVICTLNFILLFIHQDFTSYIFEAAIMAHMWVSLYFIYLVTTHLRVLPALRKQKKSL